MPLPAMSGAEPCTGSNMLGYVPLRIDVGARRQPDAAGDDGAQVGQDVAEQIAGHHHVEALRLAHEVHRRRVDQQGTGLDVRDSPCATSRKTSSHSTMPNSWAFDLVIEVTFSPACPGTLEGGANDALAAAAREQVRLQGDLVRRAVIKAAADGRIFPFGVLAIDEHVDRARRLVAQRRLHASKR